MFFLERSGRITNTVAALLALAACWTLSACTKSQDKPKQATIPEIETIAAKTNFLNNEMILPAEILPYQEVPIYPKITGFIKWIGVDRGSLVKKGQLLVLLVAPELTAQHREAESRRLEAGAKLEESRRNLASARAVKLETQAKMESDKLTYERLKEAAQTPGVVAENDVDIAAKGVEADRQLVNAKDEIIKAAESQIRSAAQAEEASHQATKNIEELQAYLKVTAPYDGVITERNMHEGSLAYPPSGANGYPPMLRIKQNSVLRIVIPVPEIAVSDIALGTPISFSVPAFPGKLFTAPVARVAHSLEEKTRTMPVELNYLNKHSLLSPGMFPEAHWPVRRDYPTIFVPTSAVAITLEKPFVIRILNGKAEWIYVKRGQTMGDQIEIFGELKPDDQLVLHASDEIANGSACIAKPVRRPADDRVPQVTPPDLPSNQLPGAN